MVDNSTIYINVHTMKSHSHSSPPSLMSKNSREEGGASILAVLEDDSSNKTDKRYANRHRFGSTLVVIAGVFVIAAVYAAFSIRTISVPKAIPEKAAPSPQQAKPVATETLKPAVQPGDANAATAHIETVTLDGTNTKSSQNSAQSEPQGASPGDDPGQFLVAAKANGSPTSDLEPMHAGNAHNTKASAMGDKEDSAKTTSGAGSKSQDRGKVSTTASRGKGHAGAATLQTHRPSSAPHQDVDEEILAALLTRVVSENKK